MNPAELERFRIALLQILRTSAPLALPVERLVTGAVLAGFPEASNHIRGELSYLEDKELIADDYKRLSPENRRYRLTAEGRDYLAQEGL